MTDLGVQIFVFILLILVCCLDYYWKSVKFKKENINWSQNLEIWVRFWRKVFLSIAVSRVYINYFRNFQFLSIQTYPEYTTKNMSNWARDQPLSIGEISLASILETSLTCLLTLNIQEKICPAFHYVTKFHELINKAWHLFLKLYNPV